MKSIQLKDVMASLRIAAIKDGYEVHNAAGSAKYDVWGYRREVNGIPEYFPDRLSVEGGSISIGNGVVRAKDSNGQTRCEIGPINTEPKLETTDTRKMLDKLQKRIEGNKAFQALTGECFINEAFIGSDDMFNGIKKDVEAIISNALATQAEAESELERIKEALARSARQAVNDAVKAVQKDFETRGPLRRTLGI